MTMRYLLAENTKEAVGYSGELRFDASKPDGMPRKALDSSQLQAMVWHPKTSLRSGLRATYEWFLQAEQAKDMAVVRSSPLGTPV